MKNGGGGGAETKGPGLLWEGKKLEFRRTKIIKGVWSQVTVCFECLSMKEIFSDRQGEATYNF